MDYIFDCLHVFDSTYFTFLWHIHIYFVVSFCLTLICWLPCKSSHLWIFERAIFLFVLLKYCAIFPWNFARNIICTLLYNHQQNQAKRPQTMYLNTTGLWDAYNNFSCGNSDREFLCEILLTCLHDRILITNWRAAKGKTDEYLKPSFVWNMQTMHSIFLCRVPFNTSHIKTLLSRLWSVGLCQSSAMGREYLLNSFNATLPSYYWPWKCLRCIFYRFHKYLLYFTLSYLIHINVKVELIHNNASVILCPFPLCLTYWSLAVNYQK